jgi:uncharacterized membrane protein HdeD (DUF308 family)
MKMPEEQEKLRKVVSGARSRVSDKLSDIWWWFLIRGVLALLLAVVALFWPQKTIAVFVNLLGAYLLIDGVLGAIGAFRSGGKGGVPIFAIAGLLVGAVLLFWTGVSVRIFLVLVGVWALIQGVGMFLSSRKEDTDPEAGNLVGLVGGVLALAGLILILWPNTGVVTVSWLLSTIAFVVGAVMIYVAFRLRRVARRVGQAKQ